MRPFPAPLREPIDERATQSLDEPTPPPRGLRVYGSGQTVWLRGGRELRIGAAVGCELRLDDAFASGHHCTLVADGARVLVRDERSKNGTFVDGNRVAVADLRAGAMLTVGASRMLALGAEDAPSRPAAEALVGDDPALHRAIEQAQRAGRGDVGVLILGETGTGKGVLARVVHEGSRRAAQPFVALDCGAMARDLISSELFGHERGAFTGATDERDGLFVQADAGTLFLDELGELPLAQQPHLLRVLETGRVRRVGSGVERVVDVRVVAATHRTTDVLRADLYHRLATVVVRLPPLRERMGDVPLLVAAFLRELAPEHGERHVPATTLASLQDYPWPGNVRELRHAVARACVLGGATLELDDFLLPAPAVSARSRASAPAAPRTSAVTHGSPVALPRSGEPPQSYAEAPLTWRDWERFKLAESLRRYGSIRNAARVLGIPRSTLADRARRLGVAPPQGDPHSGGSGSNDTS